MKLNIPTSCQIPGLAAIYEQWLPLEQGRFVEVGACDGLAYSNTSCLAEIGWTGLYVEPHPALAKRCRETHSGHPAITVDEVAISNQAGEIKLYDCGEVSSTVLDQNSRQWGCRESRFFTVPCCTLNALLEKHGIAPEFDLLVVDVEGAELQVLEGFNLERYQPKMAIIETHEKDPAAMRNWKAEPINACFAACGYTKIYADAINSIFVSQALTRGSQRASSLRTS